LGGLAFAVGLGATAYHRDIGSGFIGVAVASGAPRGAAALSRVLSRSGVLIGVLGLWCLAFQVGSLALGRGLDGPLAVHVAASAESLLLVLLSAAALNTVLGPIVSGALGVLVYVVAEAVVNLKAAVDQGVIGQVADPAIQAAYYLLPRAVLSPMIVDLQARGQGGAAAPRFEVNRNVVEVPAAGAGTILWTLVWCAVFACLCLVGLRRRPL
jgi:hypothetical protein